MKKRHGELFVYMHQQMLARYDAERLSAGLNKAVPYGDYRIPLIEGYDPRPGIRYPLPGRNPGDVDPDVVAQEERLRASAQQAVVNTHLPDGTPLTVDGIGALIEASVRWWDPDKSDFGLHNNGHGMIAELSDGDSVMNYPRTAIMDPAFFRWHRHIDDLAGSWSETQDPNAFDDAPPITFARDGVLFCFTDEIADFGKPGFDLTAWAQSRFGGSNWTSSDDSAVTDVLETFMTTTPSMGMRPYLDHRDFAFVFRLENTSPADSNVTFRVFIVPEAWAEEPARATA